MKITNTSPTWRVAAIYGVLSALWVLLSNRLLVAITSDAAWLAVPHTYTGLIFVAASTGLVYALVRRNRHRPGPAGLARVESDRMLSTLMSNLPGMAYRCRNDQDWTMQFVSEGCLELTGYQADELVGSRVASYASLIHPEDRDKVWQAVQRGVQAGQPFRVEYRITDRQGSTRWVWEQGREVTLPAGDTVLEGFISDVTERVAAQQEAERRHRAVTLLNRVITAASESLHVEDVLAVACRELARTIGVPQAGVALANEQRTAFTVVAEYGSISGFSALGEPIPVAGNPSLQYVLEHRQPLAVADAQHDPRLEPIHDTMARRGVASLLIVPLLVQDEVVGTLGLDTSEPHTFTPDEIALAANAARTISQALHNARLVEALRNANAELEQAVAERTAELQGVKERVEAILDNSPDAILLLRPDGTIVTANQTFAMLCLRNGAAQPSSLEELVVAEDRPAVSQALQTTVEQREIVSREVVACCSDGRTYDAGIALAPFEEGGDLRVVCSLRDITPIKEAERLKDAFVSNVSHELRTPITSLKIYHDLLKRNPAKADHYVERLEREIERLACILDDLLTLSRADQDQLAIRAEPVSIPDLVATYVTDRTPLASERGLVLEYEEVANLPPARADRGLVGQVLGILLNNALAYTPSGGRVTVRPLVNGQGTACYVGFSVADTGPGILPDEKPHLFDRFYRGKAAQQAGVPGTGLGLAIAREIVNRHQGRIEIDDSGPPGSGAVFNVWLPACDPS